MGLTWRSSVLRWAAILAASLACLTIGASSASALTLQATNVTPNATYKGWGYFVSTGAANVNTWRWTEDGWSYETAPAGSAAWIYPWGGGWNWVWRNGGWYAAQTPSLAVWQCSGVPAAASLSVAAPVRTLNASTAAVTTTLPPGTAITLSCSNTFADAVSAGATFALIRNAQGVSGYVPTLSVGQPPAPEPAAARWAMRDVPSPVPAWYCGANKMTIATLEMDWRQAEPTSDTWNTAYFTAMKAKAASYRAAGCDVVLSYGLHHAPDFILDDFNARYVNQYGARYTASDEPNLVFNTYLRGQAMQYTNKVLATMGTSWYAIRVGGGRNGDLSYPQLSNDDNNAIAPCPTRPEGKPCNYYWAFDGDAAAQKPAAVQNWIPGDESPNGEAAIFLNWYVAKLRDYQNWQISILRKGTPAYTGRIAVQYPAWGLRAGDGVAAAATDLAGSSAAELSGEVQGGHDHVRHISSLPADANIIVLGTSADKNGTLDWLRPLAQAHVPQLRLHGENEAPLNVNAATSLIAECRQNKVEACSWNRYGDGHEAFIAGIA